MPRPGADAVSASRMREGAQELLNRTAVTSAVGHDDVSALTSDDPRDPRCRHGTGTRYASAIPTNRVGEERDVVGQGVSLAAPDEPLGGGVPPVLGTLGEAAADGVVVDGVDDGQDRPLVPEVLVVAAAPVFVFRRGQKRNFLRPPTVTVSESGPVVAAEFAEAAPGRRRRPCV